MARASEGNEQLLCSFCGKSQRQVKKLIAGPGVYICDECIDLCNEIIDEELTTPAQLDLDNLPRPKDIYSVLNDYVVSQEESKRALGGLLAHHVLLEDGVDLLRLREVLDVEGGRPGQLLVDDLVAEIDALVADVHARACDQLLDLALRLPAEAAEKLFV